MKFNKNQIYSEEFRKFLKRTIPIQLKEGSERFFSKFNYYPLYFAIQVVYVASYVNYNPEVDKYGSKAFQYYKLASCWPLLKEPFRYEDYIDDIISKINEDLNSAEFKDEFDILGDYENKEEVDLWEYTKYLQNFRDEYNKQFDNINISEAL